MSEIKRLALDLGGANIKVVTDPGHLEQVIHQPFALWRHPEKLNRQLKQLASDYDLADVDLILVTMTGELCDCFKTAREGVLTIWDQVAMAWPNADRLAWSFNGWANDEQVKNSPELLAAANWHVVATWLGQIHPDNPALVIDVGSTTTDITLVHDGKVKSAVTDTRRLARGELLYQGLRRTPLMALTNKIELDGDCYNVMAEYFATMDDVAILLKWLPEDDQDLATADGRGRTIEHAGRRLLKMIGADLDSASLKTANCLAEAFAGYWRKRFRENWDLFWEIHAEDCAPREVAHVYVLGEGASILTPVINELVEIEVKVFDDLLNVSGQKLDTSSEALSAAACAWALIQMHDRRNAQ